MSEQESPDKSVDSEEDGTQAGTQEKRPKEYGGPKGKEPTRYGDWEKNGRCIDFLCAGISCLNLNRNLVIDDV